MQRANKVLFITHYSRLYGANRSLIDLISKIRECNIEPIVLSNENGELIKWCDKNSIETWVYDFKLVFHYRWKSQNTIYSAYHRVKNMISGLWKYYVNQYIVRDICKEKDLKQINLIFTNSAVITIGERLSKKVNIPHIHSIKEVPSLQFNLYPDFGFNNYFEVLKSSKRILFNSNFTKKKMCKLFKEDIGYVLYDYVKTDALVQGKIDDESEITKLGIFGYFNAQKNQIEALKAISLLKQNYKVKLYIIGDGDKNEILKYAQELGLEDKVIYTGFVEDVANYYRLLDIVLVCAVNEALGRVTIEAMLNEVPVIGKDSGATSEIIQHKYNGLLYDSVEDLSINIALLIDNTDLRNYLSKNGKDYAVTNFSSNVLMKKFCDEFWETASFTDRI